MIELLLIVIAFVLLILVVVWTHFINQNRQRAHVDNSFRDQTNVRLYHEHKAEIEKDFKQGNIDEENYQYLVTELDQSLLHDIEENSEAATQSHAESKPLSVIWPILLSAFILIFSIGYYKMHGSYDLVANTPQSKGSHEEVDAEQQAMMQVAQLLKLTQEEPANSDNWFSLGQAYISLGKFDKALLAYDEVIALDGEQADIYGAKAQAAYYQNNQKITDVVQRYIDKALSLDGKDPSTNILLGMHSFISQNFELAIEHWQLVIDDGRSTVNLEAIKSAVQEAKKRLAMANEGIDAEGPQLSVNVSLSDEIFDKLSQGEDKVVFIYATPIMGSRMPVAAIKVNASDLPLDVVLNNATAMTPQAKLSDVERVNLFAIVSSTGGAGIKPGDFKAELKNIAVNEKETLSLVIDSIVD